MDIWKCMYTHTHIWASDYLWIYLSCAQRKDFPGFKQIRESCGIKRVLGWGSPLDTTMETWASQVTSVLQFSHLWSQVVSRCSKISSIQGCCRWAHRLCMHYYRQAAPFSETTMWSVPPGVVQPYSLVFIPKYSEAWQGWFPNCLF